MKKLQGIIERAPLRVAAKPRKAGLTASQRDAIYARRVATPLNLRVLTEPIALPDDCLIILRRYITRVIFELMFVGPGFIFNVVIFCTCLWLFYKGADLDKQPGWLWMMLSAGLYLGMWLWLDFGWIACVLGQIGLAIAIAVYRALAEMGDADR